MSTTTLNLFLRHLALSGDVKRLSAASDHDLLASYESGRGQAAFTELMRRYGPMVLRTCHRVLGCGPDAEDAFQATFVLLARVDNQLYRKAASSLSLGGWLHRVAYRTAAKVLRSEVRRRGYERQAHVMTYADRDPSAEATWNEIEPILDAELEALPEEARRLLIACCLQEKTHAEAAAELGMPRGSLVRRLEKARTLLAARLARRGIVVSVPLLTVLLEESAKGAGVPAVLMVHTVEAARRFALHLTGALSDNVAWLVKSGLAQMAKGWTHWSMALVGWLSVLGVGLIACQTLKAWPDKTPESEPPAVEQPARKADKHAPSDRFGDPLPVEALARMGTTRLRHTDFVSYVFFAPDSKTVASGGTDGSVRLWDVDTGKLIRKLQYPARTIRSNSVSFVGDGKTLAYAIPNHLWLSDVRTGEHLHEMKLKQEKNRDGTLLIISSDGKLAASAEKDAVIRLWDVATGNSLRVLHGQGKQIGFFAFSSDNRMLASMAGSDKLVQLWDVPSGKLLHTLEHPQEITEICFSPDGKTLASAGSDKGHLLKAEGNPGTVRLWDAAAGKLLHTLVGHQQSITTLSFSPDGKLLVSGSWDRTVRLWDVTAAKQIRQLKGLQQPIQSLAFSPNGKLLASGGSGPAVRLWDVATGAELHRRNDVHKGFIRSLSFSPDGRKLATAAVWREGEDMVRIWDAASGKPLGRWEHPGWARSLAFAADGKTLASMEKAGGVRIWDVTMSQQLHQLQTPAGSPRLILAVGSLLALSPDGKLLATGSLHFDAAERGSKGILQLWNVTNGTQLHALEHPPPTVSAAFSPDGKTLAVGTKKGVYLWETATGKELWKLNPSKDRENTIEALAFAPDGKMLAVGSHDSKIYLLEVSSGKKLHTLTGHSAWVRAVAFSPNGRLLVSGSDDQTVRLWEVRAGLASECHLFRGHDAKVTALAFSPDGQRLASGSHDSTALVWDVTGVAEKQAGKVLHLTPEGLNTCWSSLMSTDASRAYRATRTLAAAPDQAVPFLAGRLHEQLRGRPTPDLVARLLAELDSDDFHVRSRATKELEKYGEAVEPALRQTLKDNPSVEVRRRVEQLLGTLHPDGVSPHLLRCLRAVEVLEWIDNADARALLRELAADLPREEVGQDAKDALSRLRAQRRSRLNKQQ